MLSRLENFYEQQEIPLRSFMLAMSAFILIQDQAITNELKYGMPCFSYKGKMFCYLWFHKQYKQPYIGFVEGRLFEEPFLLQEKRSRMKIWLLDINEDLPIQQLTQLSQKALSFYKTGLIPVKRK